MSKRRQLGSNREKGGSEKTLPMLIPMNRRMALKVMAPSEDALRFLHGLMAGALLSAASLEAMTRFRSVPPLGVMDTDAPAGDRSDGYGLGLVRMELGGGGGGGGANVIGHGGLFTGHTTGLWYVPECDLTISIFFNRGFVGQRGVIDKVVGILSASGNRAQPCTA